MERETTEASSELIRSGLEAVRSYQDQDGTMILAAETSFFEEPFTVGEIISSDDTTKLIKKVEKLIRGSLEYKEWVAFVHRDVRLNRCSFFSNLDFSTSEVGLELHHAPLTLFDIVDIVLHHQLESGHRITSLTLADTVMQCHADNLVGIVPLSKSAHKLVHSKALLIHPAQIHGNWLTFLRSFSKGVSEIHIAKLLAFVSVTPEDVLTMAAKLDTSIRLPKLQMNVSIPTRLDVADLLR